ncbi:hypothetical protein H2200_013500 [Cladophialophora chaetospira]|uniref:Uncharacterized protein n=1 Tax=Cladophialophora chaetospira TaxID=386627 RepID=A0AA38U9F0_9EURO|nr:hypothetical protein H2200_013500 [Cladophialophora chaetospira]
MAANLEGPAPTFPDGAISDSGSRSIDDLKSSSDILSGADSQALRTFCTAEYCDFQTDLNDPYGSALRQASLDALKRRVQERSDNLGGIDLAAKELTDQRWGSTNIPIYNVLLSATVMFPHMRPQLLAIAKYLIADLKIPVDGTDLSGTSTLMYSISTKPYLDLEFAQMMVDAGADINLRNRYGCTAAHDAVMVRPDTKMKAITALKWFVEHGGNVEIKDGDGMSPKFIASRLRGSYPEIWAAISPNAAAGGGGSTAGYAKVKVGRNDPCSCGSNKKFKVCCGKP